MRIGLIGGSGLSDDKFFDSPSSTNVPTKYGSPSSDILTSQIGDNQICYIRRHGEGHKLSPTNVPYKANIQALKDMGSDCIIAVSAVGSLRQEIEPGHIVFPSQFIDMTKKRETSFYEGTDNLYHENMAEPFDYQLRDTLIDCAEKLDIPYHSEKTVITIEGLRFSSKEESHLWRQWGADVINMTTVPEVCLAKEAGIPYQTIALSTDYDCWNESHESVTFEMVMEQVKKNVDSVKKLLGEFING